MNMHFWLKKSEKERENCTETTAAAALILKCSWPPPPFLRIRTPHRVSRYGHLPRDHATGSAARGSAHRLRESTVSRRVLTPHNQAVEGTRSSCSQGAW